MSSVTYVWNVTESYDLQINNLNSRENMLKGRRGESCCCFCSDTNELYSAAIFGLREIAHKSTHTSYTAKQLNSLSGLMLATRANPSCTTVC